MNMTKDGRYLYDKIISLKLKKTDSATVTVGGIEEVIEIPFQQNGYKPSIEASLEMLPQSITLAMTVKLTNSQIVKNADVRTFTDMTVTMGYSCGVDEMNYITETFSGPIMASYVEKPSPDNVIVFEGIATGATGRDLMKTCPYTIKFNKCTTTIKRLFEKLGAEMGLLTDTEKASDLILNSELNLEQATCYADNGMAVLNWFQSLLFHYSQNLFKQQQDTPAGVEQNQLTIFLENNTLYLRTSFKEINEADTEKAVDLRLIKNASFAGPALTVSALYDPRLHPGDLFYMPPIYYKGGVSGDSGLLNVMSDSVYNPDNGFYRALTIRVSFSSNGTENDMQVLALPQSQYEGEQDPDDVNQYVKDQVQAAKNRLEQSVTAQTITIGEEAPAPVEDVPAKDMWSTNYNPSIQEVVCPASLQEGSKYYRLDTLSQIAEAAWGREYFYLADSELKNPIKRNAEMGVPLYYFFPLISIATDKMMQTDKEYYIRRSDPDFLRADKKVAIPAMSIEIAKSYIGNKDVIQIMREMAAFYEKKSDSTKAWAPMFTDIANYLENGK